MKKVSRGTRGMCSDLVSNEYESLYPCRVHLEKVIDQVFEAGGR